ncbi:polyketide synthase [Aspergillus ustus]|uniref:Polyketide synthase n=1 Tax=Aspergillus ustus TaxID=40382 RepID=A0A0C1EH41_ASPUT|nr:polyketide synthase [Aspergillus ustus]
MTDSSPIQPIAVTGLSFRLPGDANDIDGLWKLLESGESAWTPVPQDRYNGEAFYHPNADDPNGTSNHPGGHFITPDIRNFDHAFFQISKAQAAAMDPQQRMLLELTYEALESSGISREAVAGSATSVFAPLFPMDYDRHLYKDPLNLPVYYGTGVEKALLSNRISHALDLRGPSMTLDTACSGSLVALHLACQSLRSGECDTAIVAASNLILGPDHSIGLSNLHLLSSTGRCYPFDDRGDGYGRGEGVVVLVLKRVESALADRTPIRAVIRNTAVNQDGLTPKSITYPNGQAQADLARKVYAQVGLRPEEVAYVEAHGTGTRAGDKEELGAIADVFAGSSSSPTGRDRTVPLYVGSIKGALGHAESAAGLASLLKALVMLDRELIPPVAGFTNPKPGLPLEHIKIPTGVLPWPHAAGITPRISINSFGFGGTNAHVILERGWRPSVESVHHQSESHRLFTLSAYSAASLKKMMQIHHKWFQHRGEKESLADISYTLLHRRSALPYRFSVAAHDKASLLEQLGESLMLSEMKPIPSELDLVAVFTGQGAQWAGMGHELLLATTPSCIFRDSIRTSRDILHRLGANWSLDTELLAPAETSRLGEAELGQPATTAVQIALIALLRAQGVRFQAVVGHSSGEIAAAYAAGYLSHKTAIRVAFHRGVISAAVASRELGPGAMMSVGLGEHEVAPYLEGLSTGEVVVACINSPRNVTVSGDADAVDEVAARLVAANQGIFHRKLLVDTAYHSHHMRTVAEDYRSRLGKLSTLGGNGVSLFSSVTGQLKTSGFDEAYWIGNLVSPVRFSDAVQTLAKLRHRSGQHVFFVEVGPHSALSGPVRQSLQHEGVPAFPFDYHGALQRNVSATAAVLALVGKLFERGMHIHWDEVSALAPGADTAVVRHDLPAYPWDHSTKHWHESRLACAYRLRKEPYHDLLGVPLTEATDLEPRWRHFISRATLPWLADHVVDRLVIFPGAGYICMAIEGVAQLSRQRFPQRTIETLALSEVSFNRGLVVPERERVEMQLRLQPRAGSSDLAFAFSITALSGIGGEWYEHASGVVEAVLRQEEKEDVPVIPPTQTEKVAPTPLPQLLPGSETVPKETLYQTMGAVGNTYGPAFAALNSLIITGDVSEGASSFEILDVAAWMPACHQRPHIIHPCTLESIFQNALPLAGRRLGPGSIVPVHIGDLLISVTPTLAEPGSRLDVSTTITSSHFRTAVFNMTVLAGKYRAISITDIKFRSLASSQPDRANENLGSRVQERQICYELQWHADINFMRLEDLPPAKKPCLADIIARIAQKGDRVLSTAGLGASVDLTQDFLTGLIHSIAAHDFVDVTPGRFDVAVRRLTKQVSIQYRTLRPAMDPVARGFEAGKYDIVLAGSAKWLKQATIMVKSSGLVLLVLSEREAQEDSWRLKLSQLEEVLAFREDGGRLVAVLKPDIPTGNAGNIHILTHSVPGTTTAHWASALETGLAALHNTKVTIDQLGLEAVEAIEALPADTTVLVVDDRPDLPILNDRTTFDAASKLLLRKPARVVWVSPDDPAPFHQIEGVSRTAHAENDHLRLVTIHVSSDLLVASQYAGTAERLVKLAARAVQQVSDNVHTHTEREYILSDGAVLVPRLESSERLNRAIAGGSIGPEIERHRFVDTSRHIALPAGGEGLFEDEHTPVSRASTPLENDSLEIAVQSFVLSKSNTRTTPLVPYIGVVVAMGANINTLSEGDIVVALTPILGANVLRIPVAHARRLPPSIPPATASVFLIDIMAATYAFRDLARVLSSTGTVLIHGVRTTAGRAAVAVARSIGVRIISTAPDSTQACLIREEIGIHEDSVLLTRPSMHRRLPRDLFPEGLDAVFQADDSALPVEVLGHIKPFGSLVVLGSSRSQLSTITADHPAVLPILPSNVSVHSVDLVGLLRARPDLTTDLLASATPVLEHIPPLSGAGDLNNNIVPVMDVSETADALQVINSGLQTKVVLQASPTSLVKVLTTAIAKPDPWLNEDATYVIAGGLGDIGQRFLARIAHRGAKHIATLSRRAVDADTYRSLQEQLECIRPGIRLYILRGDVTSEVSLQAAAAVLRSQGAPPVRGVIQCAVVMKDRPLELVNYDEFTNTTKTKVDGTLALHRALASPDLAFFLSLSSVASIVGASAEAAYNAGNAVQDSLAHQQKQCPNVKQVGGVTSRCCRFLTANLGWTEGAALTAGDETRQAALRRAGFCVTKVDELTRFIDYILAAALDETPSVSHAIIGFDAQSLEGATAPNGTIKSALFSQIPRHASHLTNDQANSGGEDSTATGAAKTFQQVVSEGNVEAITEFISSAATEQIARLISVEASSIDPRHASIMALGLDSLVVVELRNWIMREFGAPLQSSEISAKQTVWGLAERIVGRSDVLSAAAASEGASKE